MHDLWTIGLHMACLWPLLLTRGPMRTNDAAYHELIRVMRMTPILPIPKEWQALQAAERTHRVASRRCDRIVFLAVAASMLQYIALNQWL